MSNYPIALGDVVMHCLFTMVKLKPCRKKLPCFQGHSHSRFTLNEVIHQVWDCLPPEKYCRDDIKHRLSFCLFLSQYYPDWILGTPNPCSLPSLQDTKGITNSWSRLFNMAEYGDKWFPFEDWQSWQSDHHQILSSPQSVIKRLLRNKTPTLSRIAWQFVLETLNLNEEDKISRRVLKFLFCGCHTVKIKKGSLGLEMLRVRYLPRSPIFTFQPAGN